MTSAPALALTRRVTDARTRRLLTLAVGAVGALSALKPLRESDLFWHLSLGRAVLRAGGRVVPEPTALAALGSTRAVPEWLWDVISYALWTRGGAVALTLLIAALGALIASLGWRVLRGHDASRPLAPAALCLALALPSLLGRVRERPEVVALALLLASLLLLRRWASAPDRRVVTGAALTAVGVVWAQCHGTAPLLAAMVFVAVAPSLVDALRRRSVDRASLALLLAATVGCLSGAQGPGALLALRAHSRGDAVAHLGDMHRPTWESLDPTVAVMGPAFVALLVVGLGGMLLAGRCWPRRLGWAALGCAIAATAVRGFAPGGLLLLPLASAGASSLWDAARSRWGGRAELVTALAVLAVLARGAVWFEARQGPIGEIGVAPLSQPMGAVATLRTLPRGSAVYASVDAAAALGFALDGHARTLADTRIPMHFDDLEFAVSRDVQRGTGPAAALVRYDVRAAVVERESGVCAWFAGDPRWRAVQLAGAWTVFVRADVAEGGVRVVGWSPCGARWALPRGCSPDDVVEANALMSRLPRDEALALGTEVDLACGGPVRPGAAEMLAGASPTGPTSGWTRTLRARLAVRQGRMDDALADAMALCAEGRLDALSAVAPALQRAGRTADLRALLEAAVAVMDDGAPGDLRADLASVLATLGDAEGARFHATRAAALGSARAAPVLRWVARRHPDARARADAAAWERALRAE